MRKLYVPEIGDVMTLASDWSFTLYSESRNTDFGSVLGFVSSAGKCWNCNLCEDGYRRFSVKPAGVVTLPAGTKLKVDRVYIRRGSSEFSSLSFRVTESSTPGLEKKRFWAKLTDVNEMEIH